MNNSPLISVITPVYKVEEYLPKCIESILSQTFTDFELLLINDGSPDNSGKICNKYAERDSRIRVFHQKNQGVSTARNKGLNESKGKYILFVDSDDYLSSGTFLELSKMIDANNVDIILYGTNLVTQNGIKTNKPEKTAVFSIENYLSNNQCDPGLIKHVIRGGLLENIRFTPGIKLAEDIEFMLKTYCRSKNIATINQAFYNIILHEGSATASTMTSEKALNHLQVASNIFNFLRKDRISDFMKIVIYEWISILYKGYFYSICKITDLAELKHVRKAYPKYKKLYKENIPWKYQIKDMGLLLANINSSIYLLILKNNRHLH